MIKAAIIGASGYTGLELLRLLAGHGGAEVIGAASRTHAGKPVGEVFPSLRGLYDGLAMTAPEELAAVDADLFFCALPHGASMQFVAGLVARGKRVIDLSADFRIKDLSVYEQWYGPHAAPGLVEGAVYGLPELWRDSIRGAGLVANPGCYPTSALLALAPAAEAGLIAPGSVIIDAKSGVSGAGRGASVDTAYCEVDGAFKAYRVGRHRHTPEIEQGLTTLCGAPTGISFTTHLIPASRGILSTAYVGLTRKVGTAELAGLYRKRYAGEPFVRVLEDGSWPDIRYVRASNYCDVGVYVDEAKQRATIVSAIDNLVKGASGQAVQNMNVIFGLDERQGLGAPPVEV